MNAEPTRFKIQQFFVLSSFCLILLVSLSIRAQDDEMPKDVVPPSPKVLSEGEKSRLDSQSDAKKRTELAMEFMEARLKRAETAATEEKFRVVLDELAGYHALLDDTMNYLSKQNSKEKKVVNSYKNLELMLRKQTPRIEVARRALPFKYAWHVQKLIKAVREARSKAIEPLFGNTVI